MNVFQYVGYFRQVTDANNIVRQRLTNQNCSYSLRSAESSNLYMRQKPLCKILDANYVNEVRRDIIPAV